ncbi:hypothetical protein [Sulfurirhabdus autotrophica]|uniref:Uncharacterized protein n=1 Tax=Sulfurirhabdus autotrophica TaxID=1706046 RepID=A0A4R3XS85_9PROT|nr:hypothetical protein [Sulfurirhabdus autotrophica]TCV81096.1 hypothetical protein EDC63_12614 [Sulfurirhabdus autotrophica]
MVSSEEVKRSSSHPSLLSTAGAAEATNGRILSTLDASANGQVEPNGSRNSLLRGILLIGFLGIGGVGAWLIYQDGKGPIHEQAGVVKAEQASKPATIVLASAAMQPVEKVNNDLGKKSEAAAIINEVVNTENLKPAEDKVLRDHTDPESRPISKGVLSDALEADATPHSYSAKKSLIKSSDTTHKLKPANSVELAKASTKRESKQASKQSNSKEKQKNGETAASSDSDVNLLEAIVAHSTGADLATDKKLSGKQKTSSKKSQVSPKENTKTASRNTDIVERKPGDSTEALLQRCRQLGFIEGELCRWRICSGLWSVESACKTQP